MVTVETKINQKWLTLRQAAKYCGRAYSTARKEWAGWGVPVYKPFGRPLFDIADLDRMIQKHRINQN